MLRQLSLGNNLPTHIREITDFLWKKPSQFCYEGCFLLAKEKTWKHIFNTNRELLQNCTEKQILSFKTTVNWFFNDIWCYLATGCFDLKISVFQQFLGVYCILKFWISIVSFEEVREDYFKLVQIHNAMIFCWMLKSTIYKYLSYREECLKFF